MFIDIYELEREALEFQEVLPPGRIAFGSEIKQVAPLTTQGVAELLDTEIHIAGSLQTAIETICDRCLEPTRRAVDVDFDLFYRPLKSIALEEDIEIKPADLEIGFYEGHGLELDEVLKEQVLLTLPMKNICREDCAGLCPQCGQNRNLAACSCASERIDTRLAGLKNFKKE